MQVIAHTTDNGTSYQLIEGTYTPDELAAAQAASDPAGWITANATVITQPEPTGEQT